MNSPVFYQPYELIPKAKLGSRGSSVPKKGALLRFHFPEFGLGHSDCFPWPELGDSSLEEQLRFLAQGVTTPLIRQAYFFARLEAEARSKKQSLFQHSDPEIENHFLVTHLALLNFELIEEIHFRNFKKIKLKLGSHLEQETRTLKNLVSEIRRFDLKLRLDFNCSVYLDHFKNFLQDFSDHLDLIDFIEDPVLYDSKTWSDLQHEFQIRLALDRISDHQFEQISPESFSALVIKPAVQNWQTLAELAKSWDKEIVVTSYLDHPLGQLSAKWAAVQIGKSAKLGVCGLQSHTAYELNSFSELLSSGPILTHPIGLGWGLDSFLNSKNWITLK